MGGVSKREGAPNTVPTHGANATALANMARPMSRGGFM